MAWSKSKLVSVTKHAIERWAERGGVGCIHKAMEESENYSNTGDSEYRMTPCGVVLVIHNLSCLTCLTKDQAEANLQYYFHSKRSMQGW